MNPPSAAKPFGIDAADIPAENILRHLVGPEVVAEEASNGGFCVS